MQNWRAQFLSGAQGNRRRARGDTRRIAPAFSRTRLVGLQPQLTLSLASVSEGWWTRTARVGTRFRNGSVGWILFVEAVAHRSVAPEISLATLSLDAFEHPGEVDGQLEEEEVEAEVAQPEDQRVFACHEMIERLRTNVPKERKALFHLSRDRG